MSKKSQITVTTDQPRNPAWDAARETADQIRTAGRLFLRGQVRLGMILAELKKDHCQLGGGRPKKNSADSAELMPWDQLVQQETGYSRRSADIFIRLFEATKTKIKTSKKLALPAPAKKDALVLFQSDNLLTLTAAQWEKVDEVIASLTDGETQASLMQDLCILPTPKAMPVKKGDKGKQEETTAGQLAFHFFDGLGGALISTRTNPDYLQMLHALPLESTDECQLSLTTLENESRALLHDIEKIKSQTAKTVKGRTIS